MIDVGDSLFNLRIKQGFLTGFFGDDARCLEGVEQHEQKAANQHAFGKAEDKPAELVDEP